VCTTVSRWAAVRIVWHIISCYTGWRRSPLFPAAMCTISSIKRLLCHPVHYSTVYYTEIWPASWLGGQSFWLLTWGPGFDSWFCRGNFPLQATMVRVACWTGLRSLLALHTHTYHHHSHPRGNVTAPQSQKSVTVRPQPGGGTRKCIWTGGGMGGGGE
jgi:hypothetical protein